MNREQILNGIDNMTNLREKDYATIDFLLKNTSPRLFTKIIEEILLGNLYISDFESLLSDSQREKYNAIIQQEAELVDYMAKLTKFRNDVHHQSKTYIDAKAKPIKENKDYTEEQKTALIADITKKHEIPVYIPNEIYEANKEYKAFVKDNILLSLFESEHSDNAILKEIKLELYKKIYEENNTKLKEAIIISPNNKIDDENNDEENNKKNDILIPISYYRVMLDSFDIEYMKEHNISEEEMKKIKSMMLFLSNKYPEEGKTDESN